MGTSCPRDTVDMQIYASQGMATGGLTQLFGHLTGSCVLELLLLWLILLLLLPLSLLCGLATQHQRWPIHTHTHPDTQAPPESQSPVVHSSFSGFCCRSHLLRVGVCVSVCKCVFVCGSI